MCCVKQTMKICKLPTNILGTNAPKFRPGIIWQRSVSPIQMDGSYGTDIRFSEEGLFYRKISFYICNDVILSLEKNQRAPHAKFVDLVIKAQNPLPFLWKRDLKQNWYSSWKLFCCVFMSSY